MLAVHAANPRTLVSTHGLLHAAIVQRIAADCSLPPENPFFAGEPVCYYWFYHLVAAGIMVGAGLDPLHALEAVTILGGFVLFAAAVALGRCLHGSIAVGLSIGWLALVGANAFGPLIYVARRILIGPEVFADNPETIFGPYIYWSQVGARLYGPNLPYYLNITSRPAALALLLAASWALTRVLQGASRRFPLALGLFVALAAAFNPLVGLAGTGALALAVTIERLRRSAGATRSTATIRWLRAVVPMVLGLLIALPTFWHMFMLSKGGSRVVLWDYQGLKYAVAVTLGAGPLMLMAIAARRRWTDDARCIGRIHFIAAALLLAAAVVVELPEGNSHNLFNTAATLLAVPAAAWCGTAIQPNPRTNHARAFLVVFLFAPGTFLIVHAYTGRAPIDIGFDGSRIVRLPENSDLANAYAWIRAHTPNDAVLVIDPASKLAIQGNVSEVAAFTERALLVDVPTYMTEPYGSAKERWSLASRIMIGQSYHEETDVGLVPDDRPVFVLLDNSSVPVAIRKKLSTFGQSRFSSELVTVIQWR